MPNKKTAEEVTSINRFDPNEHMENIKGKPYLPVAWRIVWMRQDHPDWGIETEVTMSPDGKSAKGVAWIKNDLGRVISMGTKRGKPRGMIADFEELAETGAVGRALAYAGYGTQFAPELAEEDGEVVDSPITVKSNIQEPQEYSKPVEPEKPKVPGISYAQMGKIRGLYQAKGLDTEAMKLLLKNRFGIDSHKLLTISQASEWIEYLLSLPEKELDISTFDGGL